MLFCINGTLMRGLELNHNMLDAGAVFVCETRTAPVYRLWSIDDRYPGMIRAREGGAYHSRALDALPDSPSTSDAGDIRRFLTKRKPFAYFSTTEEGFHNE